LPINGGSDRESDLEISPITGIRPLQAVRAPSVATRPPAIFDVDASAKPGDGGGQKNGRKAAGAEEDEEDDLMTDAEKESASESLEDLPPRQINYFA
jgi:hypothetical protein